MKEHILGKTKSIYEERNSKKEESLWQWIFRLVISANNYSTEKILLNFIYWKYSLTEETFDGIMMN